MSQVSIFAKGSVLDFYGQPSNPANPPANQARMFYNFTTDQMVVIDSTGADILAVGPYSIALAANAVITWGGDTGLSRDSAGVLDVGTGAQGSKAGTINATTANITGTSTLATLKATKAVSTGINALGNVTGATAVDLSAGNVVTMTLTGATTISLTNAVSSAGQEVTFIITQDGAGGHVITWPTVVPAGIAPYASLNASSISVFKAIVDGSGTLNFSANGPVTVFRQITSALVANNSSNTNVYHPTQLGLYRVIATLRVTTAGTSGAVITLNTQGNNANQGGVSRNIVMTSLNNGGSVQDVYEAFSTAGSTCNVGWVTSAINTAGSPAYSVDLTVEYLGL